MAPPALLLLPVGQAPPPAPPHTVAIVRAAEAAPALAPAPEPPAAPTIPTLADQSTITVQIATLLVGDQEFDSAKTLSAFALGFVLFLFTLTLNFIALRVVQKYRQQYD